MTLSQRSINHGAFCVLTIGGILLVASAFTSNLNPTATTLLVVATALSGGLWLAYYRGWEYARHSAVIVLTLVTAFGIQDVARQFDPIILITPLIALLLTGSRWMVASAVAILGVLLIRANGQGVYAHLSNVIEYSAIIAGMLFSGLATDTAQRLAEAGERAAQALSQAEQQARQLEEQAQELATRNAEQRRLLDLVATLETPAVQIADGALLAPIVGHLDTRRTEALTARLLDIAHLERVRLVVLDIAGVSVVDRAVVQALLQTARALRLLGCKVFVSGITADVALTLVQIETGIEDITTVPTPQEALARAAT